MCTPIGSKCGTAGQCVAASDLFACVHAGDRCWTCFYGLLTPQGKPVHLLFIYDAQGKGAALVQDGADSGMEVGDLITEINGCEPEVDFFEKLSEQTEAGHLNITVYRNGERFSVSLARG